MSYTIMKYRAWESLWKKQARMDDILVFDEDFSSIAKAVQSGSQGPEADVWLTFVDFAPTYKFDQTDHVIRSFNSDEVMAKANQWLAKNATASHSFQWTVQSCETLYAKVMINFADSGDVKAKRVAQISKWPLLDETFLNQYDPNQSIAKQNVQLVLDGRYIVQLLRVWLHRRPPTGPIEHKFQGKALQRVGYKDYWPKMIVAKDVKEFRSNKKVLEKMNEVTDRINLDIANGDIFTGPILNVITIPCYSATDDNPSLGIAGTSNKESELSKSDQIVNVIRVFYDGAPERAKQEDLIGFADFIPECISGGGFIKYPKFETQSKLVQKASKWLAQNPELRFLNSSSVDIKLKSMTSIDSSEMSFVRNTGDFIRILRLCYTKPYESADGGVVEISDSNPTLSIEPPPPPAPVYINCKNVISLKSSTTELRSKLYEFFRKDVWRQDTDIRHRWRFLTAESLAIFTSSNNSKSKRSDDVWENSFHAISISSSMMNRNAFAGINLFYDTGYFGKEEEEAEEAVVEVGQQQQPDGAATGDSDKKSVSKSKKENGTISKRRIACTIL